MQEARDAAESASHTKSEFLVSVSHELLNPLHEIVGHSEWAQKTSQELGQEALAQPLEEINRAGNHLLMFFNELFELAQIDAGKEKLQLKVFNIESMMQGVMTSVKSLLENNHNALKKHLSANLGSMQADQMKVQHILVSLLSHISRNSLRSTITLEATRETKENADWVVFCVSSPGYSMTSDQQKEVFDALSQASASN